MRVCTLSSKLMFQNMVMGLKKVVIFENVLMAGKGMRIRLLIMLFAG
jgi:hypothetical protein